MKNIFFNLINHLFIVNFIYYGHLLLVSLFNISSFILPFVEIGLAIALYILLNYFFLDYNKDTISRIFPLLFIPLLSLVFFLVPIVVFNVGINTLNSDPLWTPFLIFNSFAIPLVETNGIDNSLLCLIFALIPFVSSFVGLELKGLKLSQKEDLNK